MSPYEAVYGRVPPSLLDYVQGVFSVAAVADVLMDHSQALELLKENLRKAQQRMISQVNPHGSAVQFEPGDWVFLKLQPYRQGSIRTAHQGKLSRRFYGPFKVMVRIGTVAYRVELSPFGRIHNVFHVSLLKRCVGEPVLNQCPFPAGFQGPHPLLFPVAVLDQRIIVQRGRRLRQFLVQEQFDAT
ncbi:hypothetical protein Syun_001574 [Stephania yunnanensis]|uniref:Tf2-1-like SH3-like domain-containing protein n=1 Tax=Stephania yunnanensis TaxID=152371 RepID=A0AAP0Q7W5_9MAGN